jgi:hypothetical protein
MSNQCSRLRYHDLGLLSSTDGAPWSTTGPRVRACALSPRRHATPMSHSAITPDVHQALDVHCHFTAQIALDPHFFVDNFANAVDLVVRQVPHAGVRVHVSPIEELLTGMESNSEDIGQRRLNTLVAGKIDPCNSRHVTSPLGPRERGRLTLPLLVPRINANHPNHAMAPDDFALFTAASNRSSNFHDRYLSCPDVEKHYARNNRARDSGNRHADSARPWRAPNTLF